jgi:hypothetical protein
MRISHKITEDLKRRHANSKQRRNARGQFHGPTTAVPQGTGNGFGIQPGAQFAPGTGPETGFGAEALEEDLEPGGAGLGDGAGDSLGDF